MPPSPASKKRKTETQVVQPVEVFHTDVKGNKNEGMYFFVLKTYCLIQGLILFLSSMKMGIIYGEMIDFFDM